MIFATTLPDILRRSAFALIALPILVFATGCGQKTAPKASEDTTATTTTAANNAEPESVATATETDTQDDNEPGHILDVKISGNINYQGRVRPDCDFLVTRDGQFKTLRVAGTIKNIDGKDCDVEFGFGPTDRSPNALAAFVPLSVGKPVRVPCTENGGAAGSLDAQPINESGFHTGAHERYTTFINGTDSSVSIRIDSAKKLGTRESGIFPIDKYRIQGTASFTANIKNNDMTPGPSVTVEMTFDCVAEGNQFEKLFEAASQK